MNKVKPSFGVFAIAQLIGGVLLLLAIIFVALCMLWYMFCEEQDATQRDLVERGLIQPSLETSK